MRTRHLGILTVRINLFAILAFELVVAAPSMALAKDSRSFTEVHSGEVHASRVPREYWRHRLEMVKSLGLDTVGTYLFWNLPEPKPGQYVWAGNEDIAAFCREAQSAGL
jgi:beta-galactosidase GanA